jgi:hypothetical protein
MTKNPNIHYTDRSRIETRHKCPRKYYWNYLYDGKGVVPTEDGPHFAFGQAVHNAMEGHATGSPMALHHYVKYVEEMADIGEAEWSNLALGLARTFREFTLPQILRDYYWIASEVEVDLPLTDDIHLLSRLDAHLRRKSDGTHFVLEAKTTGLPDTLAKQASKNFQLLLEIKALQHHLSEQGNLQRLLHWGSVGGALLLTFNKGSVYTPKGGVPQRRSPFTYWYTRELPGREREYQLKWGSGWKLIPTWELDFDWYAYGKTAWPLEFQSQIQLWPAVEADPTMMEDVLNQVIEQEKTMKIWTRLGEQLADTSLLGVPQNFGNCENDGGYNRPCPYQACCFSPNVARDPIESGLYQRRVANHPKEFESKEEGGENGNV